MSPDTVTESLVLDDRNALPRLEPLYTHHKDVRIHREMSLLTSGETAVRMNARTRVDSVRAHTGTLNKEDLVLNGAAHVAEVARYVTVRVWRSTTWISKARETSRCQVMKDAHSSMT